MEILRRYRDPGEGWEATTLEECIEHTEGSEYWKSGTVEGELKSGNIVNTPFADYKKG